MLIAKLFFHPLKKKEEKWRITIQKGP